MLDTKLEIHGVNLDMLTNQPVIILKDLENKRYLPIWIGQFEATAILMELQGIEAARPLTHDLLKTVIDQLHVKFDKVVIDDIEDGTFFAKIYIANSDNNIQKIDARPSDAIALAVRFKAPIFATDKVIEKATILSDIGTEDEIEKFRDFLDGIKPEDFKE